MKNLILIISLIFINTLLLGQSTKKSLDFSVYDNWKYIENKGISNDGNWVFYESNPYYGDGNLILFNTISKQKIAVPRASDAALSANSDFISFKIKPYTDTIRALKLKKTDKEKLPKDSLGIIVLKNNNLIKVENLISFKIPEKESSWMAYLHSAEVIEDTSSTKENKKKPKNFDDKAPKENDLTIFNPIFSKSYHFKNITEYAFSENGRLIGFIKQQNDTILMSTVYIFNTEKEQLDSIKASLGLSKKISLDNHGTHMAFIHSEDTIKTKVYSLYLWNNKNKSTKKIVDTLTNSLPAKWTVSEHGKIFFSENDERLFFGTSLKPTPEPKDTLLDEEKVILDLWSWTDPILQSQQLSELEEELERSYLTVYHIEQQKLIQLADTTIKRIKLSQKGNGNSAIAFDDRSYEKTNSWDIPRYYDIYLVDVQTGKKSLLKKELKADIDISTNGKYIAWYDFLDKNWYAYSIKDKSTKNLTKDLNLNFFDEEFDYPMDADPYGIAAWTEDDKHILIYDRYDIWQIDPKMISKPVNFTNNYGRNNQINFRYIHLNKEEEYISSKGELLLSAFNLKNKQSGFYKKSLNSSGNPQLLIMDDFDYSKPQKAKNNETLIWHKSSFKEFPDLWISSGNFTLSEKISNENPQQENYLWGESELVKWITAEGTEEEGILYKPENFDPTKKYPMIVYFYRLHSDDLNRHYIPKPSRSTINPTFYVSNGYFVFMPNIRYKVGYPGESAFNYVVSGTLDLLNERSYLDKDCIGIQGQSWGGYQAGYIITKTDLFAAASIGAPVSNMTSAYGGIRWESGMSRMFQYEKSQSRIGGTLWDKPLNYIENSPIFYAPKINTPVLIRHNDGDGAVPWYQGIEYFVALRRLDKPVWMLNYNGQPHNEKNKSPNTKDLSIRMMQFFDHYLKNKPAPLWMTQGIPATQKGKTMGYEFQK